MKLKSWILKTRFPNIQLSILTVCAPTPWSTRTCTATSPWPGWRRTGGSTGGSRRKETCSTCATTDGSRWLQPSITTSPATPKSGLICGFLALHIEILFILCGYFAHIFCPFEVICGYIALLILPFWSDLWLHRPLYYAFWSDQWLLRPLSYILFCRYVWRCFFFVATTPTPL